MKKISLKSFWSVATLVLAVLIMWGIGSKTFAYTDANYITNFTPSGCSGMSVFHLNSGMILHWWSLWVANTIYVIDEVPAYIDGNITVDNNCVALVANVDAAGNTVLNFSWWAYVSSMGHNKIMIAWFDATHRLEINNSLNSPSWILLQSSSWVQIFYTTLSGFTILWWLVFSNTSNSIISNNIITNNKDWINFQPNSSINNIISNNTITFNTYAGIDLVSWANNNTLSNNIINNNTTYGIFLGGVNWCIISNNTITNQTAGIWLSLSSNTNQNNTINNNTITTNVIWVYVEAAVSDIFSNNNISSNTYLWLQLLSNATGNIFTSDTISSNTNENIDITNSQNNQFINTTIQGSAIGINTLSNANYNIFSWVNVANNTSGTIFTNSSNNTLKFINNTNGIWLYGSSNSNSITNTQVVGQNNITISNGWLNNVVTGWLFSAATTNSTSVNISLKNNQWNPRTYDVTWAGLSGTYNGTIFSGSTLSLPITLTAGNGVKNILVTYNNGNIYYDTITLSTYIPPSGWGWGGGWGWGYSTCTSTNLVCVNGVRTLKTGAICQWGNLGLACTVQTGTLPVGSIVWSTYSTELNNAYLWAYAHGITTMNTIQKANMDGVLIRAHMAKMISNFAITLGGLTPNTGKTCTFDDIASQSTEMKLYIKISCQLGLMGINMTNFDPNGEVTRAQFGTILSRVIWWSTYDGGTPYYLAHLNALKLASIMTQISNPNMKELRGYVMLMMKRTYEWGFLNQ